MFSSGDWVIDTVKKESATVVGVLGDTPSGNFIKVVYVIETDDGECYMVTEDRLIKYDKYWFDEN